MKPFINTLRNLAAQAETAERSNSLVRRYVETADERCPLAGIWMALPSADAALDEPELLRPAMGGRLLWRAIHRPLTSLRYSLA